MATKKTYRYDAEDYPEGKIISSRGDHFETLTGLQKRAETLIRQARPDGGKIRAQSLYAWESQDVAERLWRMKKRTTPVHLFELEIQDDDMIHRGDVDAFTAVTIAIQRHQSPERAVRDYWEGVCGGERIEILARKAKVLRRLRHSLDE